jgi:hypothetical protein
MQTVNAVLSLEVMNRTQASCHRHGTKANGFGKKKSWDGDENMRFDFKEK